ncbi:MAG: chloride channel protein [Bacteroidota bacterium]
MNKFLKLYEIVINWLSTKFTPRQILVVSSIFVGITAGLAAVFLKTAVYYIHLALTHDYHIPYQYFFYLIFPAFGIILSVWFVQKHLKGKLGRGTANILHAIAKKSSFLPKDQMYSHIVTSALTVGFGGSAGLESPIVVTGSAIGSNYAKTHHINYKDRTLLLACGAAAGIAAAFNSPIAGVLFALEVLLVDVSISAFIPLIIAAATGGLLSKIILQENTLLSFKLIEPFNYYNVPYYIILGLLAGFVSVYYSRVYLKIESYLKPRKDKIYSKAIFGGLLLALLILFFPSLFGEGYESIKNLADLNPEKLFEHSILANFISQKWLLLLFIILIMFFKTIAAAITIGSGGNGGNFAPSLFVGAYLGFAFAYLLNLLDITHAPVSNFTLVAMAGILSGVFHAPLTAIFLIAEITGGYELMIPLMIVSASSYMISKYFETYSMDIKRLAQKGHVYTDDKDRNILTSLNISNLIETDFQLVSPGQTLGQLVEVVAHSKRNIFPVVADGVFVGVIVLDNIREIMFKHDMYDKVYVKEIMRKPFATVAPDDRMDSVMKKFDETGAWNLPVLEDGKYIGFVSKSSIFVQYRSRLIKTASE